MLMEVQSKFSVNFILIFCLFNCYYIFIFFFFFFLTPTCWFIFHPKKHNTKKQFKKSKNKYFVKMAKDTWMLNLLSLNKVTPSQYCYLLIFYQTFINSGDSNFLDQTSFLWNLRAYVWASLPNICHVMLLEWIHIYVNNNT